MAEESLGTPVTPDIISSNGGSSRITSLPGAGSSNSREKTLSRYLSASAGSCHDYCKFGKKHEFEEKTRLPFRKRIIKRPCDEPNLFASLDLPQRKNTSAIQSKSFPNSRTHTPDTSELKLQVSSNSPGGDNSRRHEVAAKKEKTSVGKLKPKRSPNSSNHSPGTSDVIKLEEPTNSSNSKTHRKNGILSEKEKISLAKFRPHGSSSEKVGVSLKGDSSRAKEKRFSERYATSLKGKSGADELPSASVPSQGLSVRPKSGISDMQKGKKTATSKVALKKVLASPRASLSPRLSLTRATSLTARKNRNLKVVPPQKTENKVKKTESDQPLTRATSLTARNNRNLKVVPPQKTQNKVKKTESDQPLTAHDERDDDPLKEKTLYVIKMETENILLESDKNENCAAGLSPPVASSPKSSSLPISPAFSSRSGRDQDESEYTVTGAEDDSDSEYDEDESVNMEETEILDGENGKRSRKSGMVLSNDKDGQPVKLSFRRGRIIEIKSENNGPRRLKFRRGRVLGDNQNVKANRRTFRQRGDDGDKDDNKPSGEKVVLRHQDVQQGKKDEKGLFNNVIEETASKLVETRKSKVKALVGAFETVISLQDAKPSANT